MKYGLSFPNGGTCGDARTLGELAHQAEESGWDGVFLEDYIVWQSHPGVPTYDPWIGLAAMAMQTSRIRLGTMVTALPRRRPWKVARETATLDHLSNGRLILGVGLGDTPFDISFSGFGEQADKIKRAKMLDESLDILAGLWSGQPFSHHGECYQIDEVAFLPRPVQTPRIPIWIGGVYPNKGPMRRAARWDGACLYKSSNDDFTPSEVRDLKGFVEQQRQAQANGYDIALGGRLRSDDWEQDRALINSLAKAGMTWWIEYLPPQVGGPEEIRKCITRGPLRTD